MHVVVNKTVTVSVEPVRLITQDFATPIIGNTNIIVTVIHHCFIEHNFSIYSNTDNGPTSL